MKKPIILSHLEEDFLRRIAAGQKPGLASREDDRARQRMRRLGFVTWRSMRKDATDGWRLTDAGARLLCSEAP